MLTMFRRRSEKAAADQDAERLIRDFGSQAFSAAGEMSWREDAGLLSSRSPGHWHRVQQEIARRIGQPPSPEAIVRGFDQAASAGAPLLRRAG